MKWEDISVKSRQLLTKLGLFSFTTSRNDVQVSLREYYEDYEGNVSYDVANWSSADLREISAACTELADYLDLKSKDNK